MSLTQALNHFSFTTSQTFKTKNDPTFVQNLVKARHCIYFLHYRLLFLFLIPFQNISNTGATLNSKEEQKNPKLG